MPGWNWTLYQKPDNERLVNVKPIADLRLHIVGADCWCKPEVKLEQGHWPMVLHNAADHREVYEYDNPANSPFK